MANKEWRKTELTGGSANALDGISVEEITHGDTAIVYYAVAAYFYLYSATATAAESSPNVIRPDDYVSGGNWVLQSTSPVGLTPPSGAVQTHPIIGMDANADTDTAHDVSVAAGVCLSSDGDTIMEHDTAMVKRIDAAWSAGTTNGGMLSGSVAADTLYDFYAIYKESDGSVDFGWLARGTDITANYPSGYTKHRWLRYHLTDSSANICHTVQRGNYISHSIASDWVLSASVGTSYASIDHTGMIPTDRVEAIQYGAQDVTNTAQVYASNDGTNVAFVVATTNATVTDTAAGVWGHPEHQKTGFQPFHSDREFKSAGGTNGVLIQAVKLRR